MRWHHTSTTRCGSCASLRPNGVVKSAYRRSAGPGFYFILEGPSIDSVRERIDATLPFVIENLATLEYDAIYEI
jgi:hypothetical protein